VLCRPGGRGPGGRSRARHRRRQDRQSGDAEAILEEGKADLVALGRSLIADPDWPCKLAEGRDEGIVGCLWDNVGCLRDSIHRGLPIRCI
jgi:2,4-dienoyl-CoA reductase-like NADH-dependent reductase (Old Yellow Enzyme family)